MIYELSNTGSTVKTVIHISDLHFTIKDRYLEYEDVFNKFTNALTRYDKLSTVVVITGDIFNEKNKLESKLVSFVKSTIYKISRVLPVFMITGNHDLLSSNRNIPDSITSVFFNDNDDDYNVDTENNIYYLKNTGYYVYNNVGFGVLSIFDVLDNTASGLRENVVFPDGQVLRDYFGEREDAITVALLHTTVKNSLIQTNDGHSRYLDNYENHIAVEDIRNYDYVMLGDVHKFQYIDNACYPSSLVQQNFGEDVLDHGYVVYDLIHKKRDFQRIIPKYGFIKCHVKINRKKVNVILPQYTEQTKMYYPTHVTVRLHIDQRDLDNYVDAKHTKDDLLTQVYTWFDTHGFVIRNCEIFFENENVYQPQLSVFNVLERAVDWTSFETIERYVRESAVCTNEQREDVLSELRALYEISILQKNHNSNLQWSLKSLEWSNMFCYGENNKIDFTDNPVNIVLGNNYSGKSTIIDILLFALYGNATRADKIVQVINNNKKSACCSLVFTVGDDVFKIERYLKKKTLKSGESHGQKVYLKRIRGETYENVIVNASSWTGEKVIETPLKLDEYTTEIFGNKYNFMSTYILNQTNSNSFVHMKNTERKELIESWLHLDCLEEIRKNLKNQKKTLDDEYLTVTASLKQLESVQSSITMENINPDLIKSKIQLINQQIENFTNRAPPVKPLKPTLTFRNVSYDNDNDVELCKINLDSELRNLKDKVKTVYFDLNGYQRLIEELEIKNKSFQDISQKYKKLKTGLTGLNNFCFESIADYENEIERCNVLINEDVLNYFTKKENYIPPNKQRQHYTTWLREFNVFINDNKSTIDRFFENVDNHSLFIKQTKLTIDNEKQKQNLFEKYSQDLAQLKYTTDYTRYQYRYQDIDNDITQSARLTESYWSEIEKVKTQQINVDKHDTTFCLHYYEYIDDKITKLIDELQEREQEFSIIPQLNTVEYYNTQIEKVRTVEKELSSLQPSVKNLSKFTFSNTCECCNKNNELLKYKHIMDKYEQLKSQLKDLQKNENVDTMEKHVQLIEKYKKFQEYMVSTMTYIEQLREEKSTYLTVKSLFLKFKNEQKRHEYLRILKLVEQNRNTYDRDYEIQFLNACELLQRYDNYKTEQLQWTQYVDKYDEYERYLSLYDEQMQLKQTITKVRTEMERFQRYAELKMLELQYNDLQNSLRELTTERAYIEKNKQQYDNVKLTVEKIQSLEMDIYCFNELYRAYQVEHEKFVKSSKQYIVDKSEYDRDTNQNHKDRAELITMQLQLNEYEMKLQQREKLQQQIETKKASSYEIYCKLQINKICTELMSLNGYNQWIYKNVVPLLNTYVNDILKNVVDFTCDIRLENENGKASINVYIKNSNSEHHIPIKMTSGFQTQILNIAFRLCLIRLNNSVGNVMFMDESFVSFDVNYQSKIPELLSYFAKYIKHVFIISHHSDLEKFIKGKYRVERNGLYSQITK